MATVLAGTVFPLATAAPADADPGVCWGQGRLQTPFMQYPIVGVPNAGSMGGSFGTCLHNVVDPLAFISGSIHGNCYLADGNLTILGHSAAFTIRGTQMTFFGAIAGTLTVTPSGNCLTGTSSFEIRGSIALV